MRGSQGPNGLPGTKGRRVGATLAALLIAALLFPLATAGTGTLAPPSDVDPLPGQDEVPRSHPGVGEQAGCTLAPGQAHGYARSPPAGAPCGLQVHTWSLDAIAVDCPGNPCRAHFLGQTSGGQFGAWEARCEADSGGTWYETSDPVGLVLSDSVYGDCTVVRGGALPGATASWRLQIIDDSGTGHPFTVTAYGSWIDAFLHDNP